jgi:hypothetical protein
MLETSFHELAEAVPGTVGIAIVDANDRLISLGTWLSGVAWSTVKVPLAIAAARAGIGDDTIEATITQSDNAAAEELWSALGDSAAQLVRSVVREAGDPTTAVESRRLRAEYTPFGQTQWSLVNQARFAAGLTRVTGAARIIDLMRNLCAEHRWGLAAKGFAAKGGWGPGMADDYLVRQFGIVPTQSGTVGVTLAAEVHGGGYEAAVDVVNSLTDWVVDKALSEY